MENKVGNLIKRFRLENDLTQKQLADKMNISDKAVSKWERGLGLPDISLVTELSSILGVDLQSLLLGEIEMADASNGNMKKTKFFVCPTCHNITMSTGGAEIICCGKKLAVASLKKANESEKLSVVPIEGEWYISSDHPMTKSHHISFVAFLTGNSLRFFKLYPEWNLELNVPQMGTEILVWYCTVHGLFYQNIRKKPAD